MKNMRKIQLYENRTWEEKYDESGMKNIRQDMTRKNVK